jgi:hypothetical protein
MLATRRRRLAISLLLLPLGAGVSTAQRATPAAYSLEQVKSYPFPNELTAASTGSRIAWAFNERGLRNIWVAEGPAFTARQLTRYMDDDGQELTSVQLSPDGEWVVYVRGGDHGSNWDDEVPVNVAGSPMPVPVRRRRTEIPRRGRGAGRLAKGRRRRLRAQQTDLDRTDRRIAAGDRHSQPARRQRADPVVAGRLAARVRLQPGDALVHRHLHERDHADRVARADDEPRRESALVSRWASHCVRQAPRRRRAVAEHPRATTSAVEHLDR